MAPQHHLFRVYFINARPVLSRFLEDCDTILQEQNAVLLITQTKRPIGEIYRVNFALVPKKIKRQLPFKEPNSGMNTLEAR